MSIDQSLHPSRRVREVWLDARGLGRERRAQLTKQDVEAFHAVLVAKDGGLEGLECAPRQLAVEVDGPEPEPRHELADVLVFSDASLLPHYRDLGARRALRCPIRQRADLGRAAGLLRQHRFDYGIIELDELTNIPLEFLIAWFQETPIRILKRVSTVVEGAIASGTLELGCNGIVLASQDLSEIQRASGFLADQAHESLELVEWEVTSVRHVGAGHRACVDVTTLFDKTEGMLVGSTCGAMILMCSETHDLPYMPLRPFRVNAGGIHSYIMGPQNQTNYLGDLRSGARSLAVDASGRARPVVVGRVKIERRPLVMLEFERDGIRGSAFVQDDWHVRIIGAGGEVLNVTSCTPGTRLLGLRQEDARHCGMPINEQLIEV